MLGGGCRGGIPGLGLCTTPRPGRVIAGATGDPRWLSVHAGCEGVLLSALDSSVESSRGFSLPAAKEHKIRFYQFSVGN